MQSPTATTTRPRVRRTPWTLEPSPRVPRRARDSPRTLYAALERQSLVSFEDIFEDIFENSREECAVRRRATRAHLERLGRSRAREKVRLVHVRAVAHFDFRFTRGHGRETTSDARGGFRRRRYDVGATRRLQSRGYASRAIGTVMWFRSHEEIGGEQGDCLFGCFVGEKEESFGDVSIVARLGAAQRRGHDRGVLFGDALE